MLLRLLTACFLYALCAPSVLAECLLLSNGELLEGQITADGSQLVVRLPGKNPHSGGELRISALDVAHRASTREQIYHHLSGQLGQPQSHWTRLRLAEWTLQNRMFPECARLLADASENGQISRELARLQIRLTQSQQALTAAEKPPGQPPLVRASTRVNNLVRPEVMKEFCVFVQPLLLNSCAKCHTAAHADFALSRPQRNQRATRRMTENNLLQVIATIEREQLRAACDPSDPKRMVPRQCGPAVSWNGQQLDRLTAWVELVQTDDRQGSDATVNSDSSTTADGASETTTDPFDPAEFNLGAGNPK